MAGTGVMMKVRAVGVEQATRRLTEAGKKIDPVLRGALNTTATKARTERYVSKFKGAFRGPIVRRSIRIKRARRGVMNARVIPSGSGILVTHYQTWGYDPISATRGRIWVRGPNGRKVAAGFVNPSSSGRLPWMTKSTKRKGLTTYQYRRDIQLALGPSAAYWFGQLNTNQTIRWVNAYLQQEFAKRMRKELSR